MLYVSSIRLFFIFLSTILLFSDTSEMYVWVLKLINVLSGSFVVSYHFISLLICSF